MPQHLSRHIDFAADSTAAAEECARDVAALIESLAERHFGDAIELTIDGGKVTGHFLTPSYDATIESAAANEYMKGGFCPIYRFAAVGTGRKATESTRSGHRIESFFAGIGLILGVLVAMALIGLISKLVEVMLVKLTIAFTIGCGALGSGLGAVIGHLLADRLQDHTRHKASDDKRLSMDIERWSAFLAELEPSLDGVLADRR